MRRTSILSAAMALSCTVALATPAMADHTDPRTRLAPTHGVPPGSFETAGRGTWRYIRNFPVNPGTDLEFFRKAGRVYAASGTLGQAQEDHVGQRIVRLVQRSGAVRPRWVADHGSAHCPPGSTSVLGLQHDSQVAPRVGTQLLIDTTDALSRCHDPDGGGLELIDVSGIARKRFEPREIHLIRFPGFSHTHTVDAQRPWIVYNSSSDFSGRPWIEVVDVRSCMGLRGLSLEQKRNRCRPEVFRIPFQPNWSRLRSWDTGELRPGTEAACHDITSKGGRIYCAGLNATLIFDVSGLTRPNGSVRGQALDCEIIPGTDTGAEVTDCSGVATDAPERARGWDFLGTFNHPGRDCTGPPLYSTSCNSNLFVESDDGVSVSHEADPVLGGRFMLVTDERGGGVVPPGASCSEGIDNPYGNGGIHVFNTKDPSNIRYARTPDGSKAVWQSEILNPAATFCDVHVIEPIPGEQRLIVAYYSSGTKIVDYFIDRNGRWTFRETASLMLPNANTWAVEDFKIRRNANGTKTYFFLASDIQRGMDVFSWTGRPNPIGTRDPRASSRPALAFGDAGLLVLGLVVLPLTAALGRRRRRA
jgi:hypothetical protein